MERLDGKKPKIRKNEALNLVSSELSSRGWECSLVRGKARGKGAHITCSNLERTVSFNVMVVRSNSLQKRWTLNYEQTRDYVAEDSFYIFLRKGGGGFEFYIVPSKIVFGKVEKAADKWLKSLTLDGKPHKDVGSRQFLDSKQEYLNKWGILSSH